MKKLLSALILIFLLTVCALTFVSCNKNNLPDPSGFILDVETQTLNWKPIKGAKYYIINISGNEKEITTKNTSVSLEKLEAGEYEIKVKAVGDGEVVKDSDWAIYSFKREAETGLRYQLINNDTEYMLVGGGTAQGDVIMESYFREKPVTAIDDKALYGNTKITSITIGSNVKTIGSKAFSKCAKLESVIIPNNVTTIGEYAFQSCKALTSISIPDSVTEIAPHTFAWCSALSDVTIGQYVTKINDYAFANCESLTSVKYTNAAEDGFNVSLPNTLKYLGTYAFSDCTALPDISLGSSIETIATYAFMNCSSISKVYLGEKLAYVDEYAFANCTALSSVSFPDSTEHIGNGVFFGCTELSEASLGSGLQFVGYFVFNETKIMETEEKTLVVDGWLIQILDTSMEKLTIQNEVYGIASYAALSCAALVQIDAKGVKYVNDYAFMDCLSLYKATFDDALETIGARAFYGCKYLIDVNIGNNATTIGDYAFYGCESLKEMTIPDSVTLIGTRAFRKTQAYKSVNNGTKGTVYMGNWAVDYIPTTTTSSVSVKINEGTRGIAQYVYCGYSLNTVSMPDSVQYICKGAFYKSSPISLNLPKSLKYIGDYAFYNCNTTNFNGTDNFALVIPDGTEYIGRSAFYKCLYVLSLTVPESVKTIGIYAFYGCSNMGSAVQVEVDSGQLDEEGNKIKETLTITGFVSLQNGIESIEEKAFQNCVGITEITIPDSVKYLGARAFYGCTSLKNVTLGSGITNISDYTFYKCAALESVVVSDSLKTIGNYAFRGCVALKDFDLNMIESIGRYSFYGCTALTEILLPRSLVSIGDYAFRGCTSVTSIIIPNSVTTIGKHAFYGLNNTTLYCEANEIMPLWNSHFNSSYRPTFWGCTISDDGKYVISVNVINNKTLVNAKAINGISDPSRSGYTFAGWSTEPDGTTVAYTSENIEEAASGTILYAIWN